MFVAHQGLGELGRGILNAVNNAFRAPPSTAAFNIVMAAARVIFWPWDEGEKDDAIACFQGKQGLEDGRRRPGLW